MTLTILIALLILTSSNAKVDASDLFGVGAAQTVAGGGSGEGAPALDVSILPLGVAVDAGGVIYIADEQFNLIRAVASHATLETVAGDGGYGFNGEALPALESHLAVPAGLATDRDGMLYFVDLGNHSVRRIGADGRVITVVDEKHPVLAGRPHRFSPASIDISRHGELFIADRGNNMIWKLDPAGAVAPFAGTGERGFSGDGGAATAATLADPRDVCVDFDGNLFIADFGNRRVRKVGPDGIISTEVGSGQELNWEHMILAWHASIRPVAVAIDLSGELLIADQLRPRILRLRGDGMVLTAGRLSENADPVALAVDAEGGILVADYAQRQLFRIRDSGPVVVAGNGGIRAAGDGGDALNASLFEPFAVALGAQGQLFIADRRNHMVRAVGTDGRIVALAGTGIPGFAGDGGPAAAAQLRRPSGLALDSRGRLYIADEGNHLVRRIDEAGNIESVVGGGQPGFSGDGGPGSMAALRNPRGLAFDAAGRLYIADSGNGRVRVMAADGLIRTVAGNGAAFPLEAGGPALGTALLMPVAVEIDGRGRLLIADAGAHRIFRLGTDGLLEPVAGNGQQGSAQDGSRAAAAELDRPLGFAADGAGGVYIADSQNHRLLHADREGILRVLAAGFSHPADLVLGQDGTLLVAEPGRNEIRRISVERILDPPRDRVRAARDLAVHTLAALPVAGLLEVVYHREEGRIYLTHAGGIDWITDDGRRRAFAEFLAPRYSSVVGPSGLIVGTASFVDRVQPLTRILHDDELKPLYLPVALSFPGADAITRGLGGGLGADLFVHHVGGEVARVADDKLIVSPFVTLDPGAAFIQAAPSGILYAATQRSSILWELSDDDGDGEIREGIEMRAIAAFDEPPRALAYDDRLYAATEGGRIYELVEGEGLRLFAEGFEAEIIDISPAAGGGLLVLEGDGRSGRLLHLAPPRAVVRSWPSAVDYGAAALGDAASASLVLRNEGDRAVDLAIVPGPGVRSDSDRMALAPGEHRTLIVELVPQLRGRNESHLAFAHAADGRELLSVPLIATGLAPRLRVVPNLDFGIVPLGTLSRRSLLLHNDGDAGLRVRLRIPADSGFEAGATEYPEIPPGSSLSVEIALRAHARRDLAGQLLISSNDPDRPEQIVDLAGVGGLPQIGELPAALELGSVRVGETQRQNLELTNRGEVELWITQILTGERELSVSSGHLRIAPGGSRSVELSYRPRAHGTLAGELLLRTTDPERPEIRIPYAGKGLSSSMALPDGPLHFAPTALGQTRELAFEIANESTEVLGLLGAETNSTQYRVTGFPARLPPGAQGTVTVQFRPLRLGDSKAVLTLTTSGPATETLSVDLQGRGQPDSRLSLRWDGASVSANSEFEIGVTLVGARRLVGMVIELALPLGKVEFLGVQWARHGLLGEGVAPLVIHRPTGPDRIELAFSLPAVLEPDGIDGDGVLGRLRFRVRPQARGDIEIRVPRAVYRSARGATDDLAQDAVVLIAVVPGGDFDADGRVDFDDFLLLMDHLDATSPEAIQTFDLNGDGAVTLEDVFVLFAGMEPAAKALAEEKLPASSGLRAAFPNPFNAEVSLEFLLSRAQPIELVIYNALGQPVRHLGSGIRPPGVHRVVWDGRDDSGREATSGLYIAALRGTGLRSIRRLLLLR